MVEFRDEPTSMVGRGTRIAFGLLALGSVVFFVLNKPDDARPSVGIASSASATTSALARVEERCGSREEIRSSIGRVGDGDGSLGPFGAELGRAVGFKGGFVLSAKDGADGSDRGRVMVLSSDGETVRNVDLGKVRGDMPAPAVARSAAMTVAAVLEPNARALDLRVAEVREDSLRWSEPLGQGRDESLAYDIALGEQGGMVAWDDMSDQGEGTINFARFGANLKWKGKSRRATPAAIDADLPRLFWGRSSYWLVYVARRAGEHAGDDAAPNEEGSSKDEGRPKDKADSKRVRPGDRYAAERIVPSWLEVLRFDPSGEPLGEARVLTKPDRFVVAYDAALDNESNLWLAWRDDDTPSGAHGGKLLLLRLGPDGTIEQHPVAESDAGVGSGMPILALPWFGYPDHTAHLRMARLGNSGLDTEPALQKQMGLGQVLAADGNRLLVAEPRGKGFDLRVFKCRQAP